ncbi:MAG: WD40 repeat domain-containing protein [Haloarculaceae archaeon]
MLIAGSDDGLYRLEGVLAAGAASVEQVLESDRVKRVRSFDGIDGVFAATASGLYHSTDLSEWTDLGVPRERVYAVAAGADGDCLYAGTRPAHVYTAALTEPDAPRGPLEWRELEGFQDLPSRNEWRLPRHENLAQVRDIHVHPDAPDCVVAGVEVGGVHVSEDRGDTWTERRSGMQDDVHELHLVGPSVFVAATGFGLFRSTDAGRSWTRLDEGLDQRYFRSAFSHEGTLYAGAALANSSTWDDPDADPAFFVSQDGETLEAVDHPRPDETITGITALDGQVVAATHRGTVLVEAGGEWSVAGTFPTPGDVTGTYTPLCPSAE